MGIYDLITELWSDMPMSHRLLLVCGYLDLDERTQNDFAQWAAEQRMLRDGADDTVGGRVCFDCAHVYRVQNVFDPDRCPACGGANITNGYGK